MEVINPQPGIQKKVLPNSSTVLVLGILSLIPFCIVISLILGIVGLVMAKDARILYEKNPDAYVGYGNLNAGKILCIIGVVKGGLEIFVVLLWILGITTLFGALFGLIGM